MKRTLCIILCLVMTLMPMTTLVTAVEADNGPELVHTVNFNTDTFVPIGRIGNDGSTFAPYDENDEYKVDNLFSFTPSQDGSELNIKGIHPSINSGSYWGGTIAGLEADNTSIYTMIYQAKSNKELDAVTNRDVVGVGGWIVGGDISTGNVLYHYDSMNPEKGTGANDKYRSSWFLSSTRKGNYTYDPMTVLRDADGYMTIKLVFDGTTGTVTSYYLTAADIWTELQSANFTAGEDDAFGFMIYAAYATVIDTTIKNVQIYKEVGEFDASSVKTPATPNTEHDLAITEICPTPEDGAYEYVEVLNVSEKVLNLKNYYLARFGFSNGAPHKWQGTGLEYTVGNTNGNMNSHYHNLSLSDVDMELQPNEAAVIWIVSAADKDKTVADFKLYWQGKGYDLANVKIARLQAYVLDTNNSPEDPNDDIATDLASAKAINGGAGQGWLPDAFVGCVISVIKASKLAETLDGEPLSGFHYTGLNKAQKAALHNAADSIAVYYRQAAPEINVTHNYYQYVDPEAYATATANKNDFLTKTDGTQSIVNVFIPWAGMVCGPTGANGEYPVQTYWDKPDGVNETSGNVFVNEGSENLPSPGKLLYGQYGRDGEIPAKNPAMGKTSTCRVPYTGE